MYSKNFSRLACLIFWSISLLVLNGGRVLQGDYLDPKDKPKILKVDGAEPIAESFSIPKAVQFLDQTSMAWTNKHKCFTCHTNYMHLIATADFENKPTYFEPIHKNLIEMVEKRWVEKGPRWDAEVVMSAATLAFLDRPSGKLRATSKKALDRIWKVQRDDGGFDWLKCNWPPMESDDQYGAVMAAVGLSAAPEDYLNSPSAKTGVSKLKKYIQSGNVKRLHHRGMLVWAESLQPGWISPNELAAVLKELKELQRPDGGWNTPSIGKWDRQDGKPADKMTSDGYGTGFAVFILQAGGEPLESVAIQSGLKWLQTHQRESGRWYTRSVSKDNQHYLTHAGTAMAIMAVRACQDSKVSQKQKP